MKLAWKQYGDGPVALIFLHGLFASKENFHTLARSLADTVACYLIDLRNHGESPHSGEMDYAVMARDVLEFIEDRGLERPFLFGHSVGGKTAMETALSAPDAIAGLMVEDIAPRPYEATVRKELEALKELPAADIGSRREAEEWMEARLGNRAVSRFLLKNLVPREDGGYRLRLDIDSIFENYRNLLDFSDEDRRYEGPSLLLKGGASSFVREGDRELFLRFFPEARIEELAGASHWVHAEKPREVEALVRSAVDS